MRKYRNKTYSRFVNICERTEQENVTLPVYGNQVVTPSKMLEMAKNGIPISGQNMAFNPEKDGEKNPSWELPLDRLRGVDPATMWEHSQIIKQKARNAHIRDRNKYGD